MLTDLITLFTLVLLREPLESRCRFRTIRSQKIQKCAFSTFYVRSMSFGPTIQQPSNLTASILHASADDSFPTGTASKDFGRQSKIMRSKVQGRKADVCYGSRTY